LLVSGPCGWPWPGPDHSCAGEGKPGQLIEGEDGVLDEEAVVEEDLPAVAHVEERVGNGAHRCEPVQVVDKPLRGAVVGDDEEVDVGVLVEAMVLLSGGPEPEDGDDVAGGGQVRLGHRVGAAWHGRGSPPASGQV
jgi:hypothetical protein